jgi:hypothetical protein
MASVSIRGMSKGGGIDVDGGMLLVSLELDDFV